MSAHKTNFIRNHIDQELAEGKAHKPIITRFPPEPNGYLHIGHAKAICLNFGIAKDYEGRCHLRFDDTNPCTENEEFMRSIKTDIQWLGFDWGEYCYSASGYFDQIFEAALKLIKSGKAYVCSLSAEEVKSYRGTLTEPGKNSPDRERSIEENLDLFLRMRAGEFPEGQYTLRAKIDMASGNINLRDPALYRIRYAHHHSTGDTWCIYPMYDFAHALSDAIENITYSLCSLEFQDHRPLYNWCVENCGMSVNNTGPQQIEFSRLNLTKMMTSKRKLKSLVEQKIVMGWDDPRMPTLSGVRRRGYTPESLRRLCDLVGVSKQDSLIDGVLLEDCLRDDLNITAPRKMAVLKPLKIIITNYKNPENPEDNKPEILSLANHPQNESMGRRDVLFSKEIYIEQDDFMENPSPDFIRLSLGGRVRLINAYVVFCEKIIKNKEGQIEHLECVYLPETLHGQKPADGQKVKGFVHWVSADHAIDAEVRLFNDLFLVDSPGDLDNYLEVLNPNSKEIIFNAKLEPSLQDAKPEESFQFNRLGYFVADQHDHRTSRPVFNRSVTLKVR